MRSIIIELMKKWGIRLVLGEICKFLRKSNQPGDGRLASDIEEAVRAFDRRKKGSKSRYAGQITGLVLPHSMSDIIIGLIKRWGIRMVLLEIIDILTQSNDANDRQLGEDLATALNKYDRNVQWH